jgi:acyl-CoA reductase-like NAD-dependent aldehyde dehydrogenase
MATLSSPTRLDVHKTYKLFIGGKYVRSESGHSIPALSEKGKVLDNICRATRKDFRDAVVAARAAFGGWAKNSAYLRSQILYRTAEMLQNRREELIQELIRSTGVTRTQAEKEVTLSIDRLVYFAGWSDKYTQVFGSVNPVASSHFNFSTLEPTGVVAAFLPDLPALLPVVTLMATAILSGNTVILIGSERYPLPIVTFAEIISTSDIPGGVVNILTGKRSELVSHAASHMDVNAIVNASGVSELHKTLHEGSVFNLKRYAHHDLSAEKWFSEKGENPYWILDTIELKTAWHPIGV